MSNSPGMVLRCDKSTESDSMSELFVISRGADDGELATEEVKLGTISLSRVYEFFLLDRVLPI